MIGGFCRDIEEVSDDALEEVTDDNADDGSSDGDIQKISNRVSLPMVRSEFEVVVSIRTRSACKRSETQRGPAASYRLLLLVVHVLSMTSHRI